MRYRQLYIRLSEDEVRRLVALAERERRDPKRMAAYLVAEGLDRAEQESDRTMPAWPAKGAADQNDP